MRPICNNVRFALHSRARESYLSERRIASAYWKRRPNSLSEWVEAIERALERELQPQEARSRRGAVHRGPR